MNVRSKDFITEDFLLHGNKARKLYHEYAENEPIFDYHNHLVPAQIAEDKPLGNIFEVWLSGDHYKWRLMRSNAVEEKYCTGDAPAKIKFEKWAKTLPKALRNPLYHWSHLELKRYFGISDRLLGPDTAQDIYEECSARLAEKEYSPVKLLEMMNVKVLCTTDDPLDDLAYHRLINTRNGSFKIYPTFRPDKTYSLSDTVKYNTYLDRLSQVSGIDILSYDDLLEAIDQRHAYFHENGCRISDHAVETFYLPLVTHMEIQAFFSKIRNGVQLKPEEVGYLKTGILTDICRMNKKRSWTQQLHIGALRNNNTKAYRTLGPDTGFDSIGDHSIAGPLAGFLDSLDKNNELTRTVLYNLNPKDNEVMATMLGNFQDASIPGKLQHGPGWWFLDQKDGMERQFNALSNLGLLYHFIGMTTDSRSLLSFPRHEYFRRILCNLLGEDMEKGELPDDMEMIGEMARTICYSNAKRYFNLPD